MSRVSHYKYCDKYFVEFAKKLGIDTNTAPIGAHGDKCYSYDSEWEDAGIPFSHGVMIFLISYELPYSNEVRQTDNGFIDVGDWVIENYKSGHNFSQYLVDVDPTDKDILSLY